MSVFVLKILAMLTMLCDHVAAGFVDDNEIMRSIGRIAFLSYAFLLAEAFRHIKNNPGRVKAHIAKYILLAVVAEFCYDFFEFGGDFSQYMSSQSNIITLLIAFIGLIAIETYKNKPWVIAGVVFLTAFTNYAVASNFKFAGVLLVYMFYWYLNRVVDKDVSSESKKVKYRYGYVKRVLILLVVMIIYVLIYNLARCSFDCSLFWGKFRDYISWYSVHFASVFIFAAYNGTIGYNRKWFSVTYSWFYPGHLFVLGLLEVLFAV